MLQRILFFVAAVIAAAPLACVSAAQPRTPQELAALWAGTCGTHAPTVDIPPGAAYLTPGRYMDTRRAGQGWDFFWYSDASPTPDDPQDLFVVFYTYRKEPSGWRPVWYGARGQVVFDSPTTPTQRLGFVGELVKLTQFPAGEEADNRGSGRTFADGQVVGEVSLAFTALGMNGNPNQVGVHWKIDRNELNADYPTTTPAIGPGQIGDVVHSCLDNFGGLANPATAGTPMNGQSGAWAQANASAWMLMAYFYESFEHHFLLYFSGLSANDSGAPRWAHAAIPLTAESPAAGLPNSHACHGAAAVPPSFGETGTNWRHLCLMTVRGYNPYSGSDGNWDWANGIAGNPSQLRIGWLSTSIAPPAPSPGPAARVRVTIDPAAAPPTGATLADMAFDVRPTGDAGPGILTGAVEIAHLNNLNQVDVTTIAGRVDAANPTCLPNSDSATCSGTVTWYTDGSYPNASLFRTERIEDVPGSPTFARALVVANQPRSRTVGVPSTGVTVGAQYTYELWSDANRRELLATTVPFTVPTSGTCTKPVAIASPSAPVPIGGAGLTITLAPESAPACIVRTVISVSRIVAPGDEQVVKEADVSSQSLANSSITIPWSEVDTWGGRQQQYVIRAKRWTASGLQRSRRDLTFIAAQVGDDLTANATTASAPHDASVGIPAGEAGVDGGAASYELPIRVPPGRNGMTPKLALVYSSRAGNGIAGMGWSLSGLSSIHRCPRTVAQDGYSAGVQFTANDALCLDGQRLIQVAAGGEATAEYRTEIETFVRVRQFGALDGASPPYFRVDTRDNLQLVYGSTPDSQFAPAREDNATAQVLTWAIARRDDRAGNAIRYEYANSADEQRVAFIRYSESTGNATRYVQFEYEARPGGTTGDDVGSSYLKDSASTSLQRLRHIRAFSSASTAPAFEYTLAYGAPSAYSGRSLVRTITQCASGACLPPLQLHWSDGELAFSAERVQTDAIVGLLDDNGVQTALTVEALNALGRDLEKGSITPSGDFDGDGRREALLRTLNDRRLLLSFDTARNLRGAVDVAALDAIDASLLGATFADFDNDGRSDLVAVGQPTNPASAPTPMQPGVVTLRFWNGGGAGSAGWQLEDFELFATNVSLALPEQSNVQTADLDGDGRGDFLVDVPTGSTTCSRRLQAWLNQGGPSPRQPTFAPTTIDFCLGEQADSFVRQMRTLEDFDGDGTLDILVTRTNGGDETKNSEVLFGRRTPSGLVYDTKPFDALVRSPNDEVRKASLWLDINGDGLQDVAYEQVHNGKRLWALRLNRGGILGREILADSNLGLSPSWRYTGQPVDVDGDGRQELLMPAQLAQPICILHRHEVGRFPRLNPNEPGQAPDTEVVTGGDDVEVPPELSAAASNQVVPISTSTLWDSDFYWCPEDPATGRVPPGLEIFDTPAYGLYGLRGPAPLDFSAYRMNAIEFVQTGRDQFVVRSRYTPIVTRRGAIVDDLFGDGLSDLLAAIGCPTSANNGYALPNCAIPKSSYGSVPFAPVQENPGLLAELETSRRMFVARNIGDGTGGERPIAPQPPDLLTSVSWGVPGTAWADDAHRVSWSYYPLAAELPNANGRSKALYSIPARDSGSGYIDQSHIYFSSSMPVVSEMRESAGVGGGEIQRVFSYSEAMYNTQGRGFRGFRSVDEDNLTKGTRTHTVFAQKFPMSGVAECSQTALIGNGDSPCDEPASELGEVVTSGAPIQIQPPTPLPPSATTPLVVARITSDTTATCSGIGADAGKSCMFVRERVQSTQQYDPNGGWLVSASVFTTDYDAFGNVVDSVAQKKDYAAATKELALHVASVHTEFAPDAGAWWLDRAQLRVTSSSVEYAAEHALPISESTTRVTAETIGYDPDGRRLVACVATYEGGSLPPQSCDAAASASTLPVKRVRTTYGAHGNVSTMAVGARTPTAGGSGWAWSTERETSTTWAGDGYFATSARDAAHHETSATYQTATGEITSSTDANGLTTTTARDGWGRATFVTPPSNQAGVLSPPLASGTQWCTGSACSGIPEALYFSVKAQAGSARQYEFFDRRGRSLRSATQGLTASQWSGSDRIYSEDGNVLAELGPAALASPTGPLGAGPVVDYQYDDLDRVVRKTTTHRELDPAAGLAPTLRVRTDYAYTGLATAILVRRESGTQPEPTLAMERAYGSGGELLYTIDANGQRTSFWYDGAGHPVAIRNVNGGLITASYNNAGERISVTDPDRGTWTFRYNGFGEVVHQQDARSWGGVDFTYDVLGRLTQRGWIDADPINAGAPQVMSDSWFYDSFNGTTAIGQLIATRRERNDGPVEARDRFDRSVTFDALKRPLRETVAITRPGGAVDILTSEFAYDARFGRLKSRTLPGLETVYYGYSADTGASIETGDATQFVAYRNGNNGYYQRIDAMDAYGHATVTSLRGAGLGAPAVRTDTFDESTGLLTRTDTPGILSLAYRYDAYGNLTEQRDLASDRAERYAYDPLQRLTSSTRSGVGSVGSTSYAYDKLGNFTTKSDFSKPTGYSYTTGTSKVQAVALAGTGNASIAFGYDDNGNVVTRTATDPALSLAIGYDIDNHALTIRRPSSGTGQATDNGSTFRYGPDGQRYFQEIRVPGQAIRQIVYLGKDYEKETSGAGQVERWYLPGGAVRIRSTDPSVPSGTYFIHGDRLGSTSVMTDQNGQVIAQERRAFDAFGRPRAWNDWNATEGANETPARNTALFGPRNRRGFTQHEHVDRTNIIHMNGRIFDAELGRFYGVDPFVQFPSNSQSLNPYSYVLNNPMAGMDPSGYVVETVWDVANVLYDFGKLGYAVSAADQELADEAKIDLSVDLVATFTPVLPAGSSKAYRMVERTAEMEVEVARRGATAESHVASGGNGASRSQSSAERTSRDPATIGQQPDSSKKLEGADRPQVTRNKSEGDRRQAESKAELKQQYPDGSVQSEQYLRTEDGKIAKDPLTGEGRRIDNVVVQDKKVIDSVETTSVGASKARQSQKEDRIREAGGTFVRDRETKEVVPVTCPTRTDRRC